MFQRVEHTFRLDLPNGKYKVHLLSGIVAPEVYPHRRRFTVHAQGREVKLFDVGHVLHLKYDFPVTVKDGRLLLTFRGCPDVLQDNPGSLPLSRGDAKKFYVPGWLLNSLVVTPIKDRKAASRQIALDELEITHCPPEKLASLPYLAMEACAAAVEKSCGVTLEKRLPNDLFLNDRKVVGILVESLFHNADLQWAVVGIGVNVNVPASAIPPELEGIASSLYAQTGTAFSVTKLLRHILEELEERLLPGA